jgi:hypothetical protein
MLIVKGHDEPVWSIDTDSHGELGKLAIAQGVLVDEYHFFTDAVSVEITPKGDPFSTDSKDWQMVVDGNAQTWFKKRITSKRCIDLLVGTIIPAEIASGHVGNLEITRPVDAPWLTSVGGDMYVASAATLPALTSVGGDLSIYYNATLPALTSVGGDLSIHYDATLNASALTSVGGGLYVHSDATLYAPKLKR